MEAQNLMQHLKEFEAAKLSLPIFTDPGRVWGEGEGGGSDRGGRGGVKEDFIFYVHSWLKLLI